MSISSANWDVLLICFLSCLLAFLASLTNANLALLSSSSPPSLAALTMATKSGPVSRFGLGKFSAFLTICFLILAQPDSLFGDFFESSVSSDCESNFFSLLAFFVLPPPPPPLEATEASA